MLHVDMDAFFASVEVLMQPELRGRPVIVGGTGARGVVASASYEARSYGVHSGMPTAYARKLCPGAIFLSPRFDLYREYSRRFHAVLDEFSPVVEGIGLDEAFVDVSGCRSLFGSVTDLAVRLRARVMERVGSSCAVGAGPNKLVAKLASKAAKPRPIAPGAQMSRRSRGGSRAISAVSGSGTRSEGEPIEENRTTGVLMVEEEAVLSFLWSLPVGALWGVGPASRDRLGRLGVTTVDQLARVPVESLVSAMGKVTGHLLHELSWGRDDRPVVGERATKSIGHEETYEDDVVDLKSLSDRLVVMGDNVAARVRAHGFVARTITLKLRYANFATITRSHTFPCAQSSGPAFWRQGQALLATLDVGAGVRLLGLSASGLVPASEAPGEQLCLDLGTGPGPCDVGEEGTATAQGRSEGWAQASRAVDAVRARFGDTALKPASALPACRCPQPWTALCRTRNPGSGALAERAGS